MSFGSKPSTPTPPPPVPQISDAATASRNTDALRRKRGVASTILSNNLGTANGIKTLLGGSQ